MVIVVAEGAGQKLIAENMKAMGQDASGNALLLDVGLWLSQKINVRLLGIIFTSSLSTSLHLTFYVLRLISKSDDSICTVCIITCLIVSCDKSS
jgi:6-phosphofructokinase 1